jgi:RNA polymerase sigma factor (sigma-70 family)
MTAEAVPVPRDLSVTDLVMRARHGDKQAWDVLVERYSMVVWSVCRRHRLSRAEASDVCQGIWLRAVDQLAFIRDPVTLPDWLAITTQRECRRILGRALSPQAGGRPAAENTTDARGGPAEQELHVAERRAALRVAFARLSPDCRRLVAMLIEDPPVPYAEISAQLSIPVESIGPARRRCMEKLRHDPALSALIRAEAESAGGQRARQAR